jgi:hypothetical protein
MTPSDMCDMGAKHDTVKKTKQNKAMGRLGKTIVALKVQIRNMYGNIMCRVKPERAGGLY